jgi:hypothetical protein
LDAALELRRSVSLVGDWRIGKSSVLQVWYERVQKRGREVRLLTGEGPEGVSPGAFVGAIVGTKTPDDVDSAANVLSGWAERIGKLESPPLVIVDEFDGFLPRFENRFFERLRGMLGRICLLLSSRRELDRLYQELGRTSPFHNRLELEWVGLLEPDAADRLTLIGNDALGLRELQMIREWAGRHPFYIQLVGHHLVDSVRRGEGVTTATDRFQTEAAARFRELWRVLDERDQDALRKTVAGIPAQRRSLRLRGLVTEEGWPFGRIFTEWLREEI